MINYNHKPGYRHVSFASYPTVGPHKYIWWIGFTKFNLVYQTCNSNESEFQITHHYVARRGNAEHGRYTRVILFLSNISLLLNNNITFIIFNNQYSMLLCSISNKNQYSLVSIWHSLTFAPWAVINHILSIAKTYPTVVGLMLWWY